jgi:uncharacterized protein YndB with AHSA1/START domain
MPSAATRTLVVERELPHPPEKIWRALTQGPLIEAWLTKNDFQPIVGRRFNPRLEWGHGLRGAGGQSCQRLVYSWNASGDQAMDGLKTIVTWTLTPRGSGTHVRMEQSGFRPQDQAGYRGMGAGRAFLEGWRKPSPDHNDQA